MPQARRAQCAARTPVPAKAIYPGFPTLGQLRRQQPERGFVPPRRSEGLHKPAAAGMLAPTATLTANDSVGVGVGGAATNVTAPAVPAAVARDMGFIGLIGLAVKAEFRDPRYFAMHPAGPNPKAATTRGFFEIAMAQNP